MDTIIIKACLLLMFSVIIIWCIKYIVQYIKQLKMNDLILHFIEHPIIVHHCVNIYIPIGQMPDTFQYIVSILIFTLRTV